MSPYLARCLLPHWRCQSYSCYLFLLVMHSLLLSSSLFRVRYCNALPRRVREGYCDINTRGENILTYVCLASVQARVRVWKHSDNIHSNRKEYKYIVVIERDPVLHEYYIKKSAKVWFTSRRIQEDAHELQKRFSRASQERVGRKWATVDPLAP